VGRCHCRGPTGLGRTSLLLWDFQSRRFAFRGGRLGSSGRLDEPMFDVRQLIDEPGVVLLASTPLGISVGLEEVWVSMRQLQVATWSL